MYKVIAKFADLEDGNHIYNIGDEYPRKGYFPIRERIEFLASDQNKLKTPVIEFIPEKLEDDDIPKKKKSGKNSEK